MDFHSHLLAKMDDGSRSLEESLEMISAMCRQGIDCLALTPHFYANDESVDAFLKRRQAAFEELKAACPAQAPRLLLGAEVRFYDGISRLEGLSRLCLDGGRLLLLEMPMNRWTEYAVREVCDMASRGKVTVVLAHIERYLPLQKKEVWERLLESGVLMQSNADFFLDRFSRGKALRWLKEGRIHWLGSDCHDRKKRPPNVGEAMEIIRTRLGPRFAREWMDFSEELISEFHEGRM